MVGYRKAMVPHKYLMVFLIIIDVWTVTFFPTLKSNEKIVFWCCVWVEKEGIQIVEHGIGSVWMICRGIGQTFQFIME
jgi:hypothetical protein